MQIFWAGHLFEPRRKALASDLDIWAEKKLG